MPGARQGRGRRSHFEFGLLAACLAWALLVFGSPGTLQAQTTILHLKNGDRITGTIIAQDSNRVVMATAWSKELIVPLSEIEQREPALAGAAGAIGPAVTNKTATAIPGAAMAVTSVPSLPPPKAKPWKIEAKVGADFLVGAKDQEIYYGRLKLTYQHPYAANPKEYFRNITDYAVDYGQTEGEVSANRMEATDKTDFDIGRKFYLYDLVGISYDEVRKIDLKYEIGPGLGYHLFTASNFVANIEAGIDYQVEYRADETVTKNFFPRLAEDVTWKLNHRLTFSEKVEFFPPADSPEYRARVESNLSYALWQNLSLNVSVLDLYDSRPALDVPSNDLQIRSSIGITF